MSKGSKQRPTDVEKYSKNYDLIFKHSVVNKATGEKVKYRYKEERENNERSENNNHNSSIQVANK